MSSGVHRKVSQKKETLCTRNSSFCLLQVTIFPLPLPKKKNNSFRKNHEKLACFSVSLLIVKLWEHSSTPERKIVDRIWFPSPSSKVIFFPCSPTSFSVLVKKNRKIQQKTQNNGLFSFKGNNFGKFFSTVKSKKKYFTSAYFARERRLRFFVPLSLTLPNSPRLIALDNFRPITFGRSN